MAVKKKRPVVKKKKAVSKKKAAPRRVPKKKAVKKSAVKTVTAKKKSPALLREAGMTLEKVGEVTHYFPKVKAAAVKIMKGTIALNDEFCARGHTTNFKDVVRSLQLDRTPLKEGKKGQEVGLAVKSRVRSGDSIYKVTV